VLAAIGRPSLSITDLLGMSEDRGLVWEFILAEVMLGSCCCWAVSGIIAPVLITASGPMRQVEQL
jgi:hypothetical protein